eukprot:Skav222153  [mRNA]  locus=scaffold2756:51180:52859:- [translate_table: standard]
MVALTLEYSNLAQHQASVFKQLQGFRKEGQLCDVAVKSRSGTEHRAHKAVLCAASADLKNMLVGPFQEANQVQQGQPVQMEASDAVVLALLDYIYCGELQVELEDSLELLRLADAYNFPELAGMIEAGLCAALDSASVVTALKVLRHARDLHELSAKCEQKVAANFEMCIELDDYLELTTGQLGRILRRADLTVSHEEVVVKGLFNWFNRSKDRGDGLVGLLHHIDFQSLSSSNLTRLRHLSASIGPVGHDLQREVKEALQFHKKRSLTNTPDAFQPKRRCLQNWSPDLGASSQAPRRVLPNASFMHWHDGAMYSATFDPPSGSSILRWKPGDAESQAVAGKGARVNGVNDLGPDCRVSLSPEGQMLVVDYNHSRLVSFENGSGNVVLSDVDIVKVSCLPTGAVYALTQDGGSVQKLVGARLQPVIASNDLPARLQFDAYSFFVTEEEVIYLSDRANSRILRLKPGEAEPVVVGEAPSKEDSELTGLFVTENEKIYVADYEGQKVWAFHPGDAAWTEVLACPEELEPLDVLVDSRSLYVSMCDGKGLYEYLLPPKLQLP